MANPSDSLWRYADAYQYMERVGKMPPVIIVCACNGGVQGKEANDNLPETADEIADSVYGAYQAGAAMVHFHARDPKNSTRPATTTEVWYDANKKIRERCPDIIINNTTGGGPDMTMEERLRCLPARPEVASLNLTPDMSKFKIAARKPPLPFPREEMLYDECLPFTYKLVNQFAAEMKKHGIKPEMETYHTGGPWVMRDLIQNGVVEAPYWIQTVMGYQTSSWPTFENVIHLVREMPENTLWLTSGIGPHQLPDRKSTRMNSSHLRLSRMPSSA